MHTQAESFQILESTSLDAKLAHNPEFSFFHILCMVKRCNNYSANHLDTMQV